MTKGLYPWDDKEEEVEQQIIVQQTYKYQQQSGWETFKAWLMFIAIIGTLAIAIPVLFQIYASGHGWIPIVFPSAPVSILMS